MLELGRQAPVHRRLGPSVIQKLCGRSAKGHNGLYGHHKARNNRTWQLVHPRMQDLRLFVYASADAVSYKIRQHRTAVPAGNRINGLPTSLR